MLLQHLKSYLSCAQLAALVSATLFSQGCGAPSADQQAEQAKDLPQKQFEWGMERLQRKLRISRPSTADGLFTERKMTYELIEPGDGNDHYTALVTITTAYEFLHGKRKLPETKEKDVSNTENGLPEDPLSSQSDKLEELIEAAGTRPNAPAVPAANIVPRSLDSEAIFELAFLDGKWKLLTEPEHKYEKMWFESAFPDW